MLKSINTVNVHHNVGTSLNVHVYMLQLSQYEYIIILLAKYLTRHKGLCWLYYVYMYIINNYNYVHVGGIIIMCNIIIHSKCLDLLQ